MNVAIQNLKLEMNERFAEQEKSIRQVYGELKEGLDRIQRAVVVGNSVGPGLGNSSNFLGNMDHVTPVFTRYVADGQGTTGVGRLVVPSTPPNGRLQLMPTELRSHRGDSVPQGERADWGTLTASSLHEATPAVSPQKQWANEELAQDEQNPSVDYTCFETLDRLVNEDEMNQGSMGQMLSFLNDDEAKQQQQQQSLILCGAKHDIQINALGSVPNKHLTTSLRVEYVNGRPKAVPILDGAPDEPEKLGIDVRARCKVLVEFKRKRVLQFESKEYVPPGSYVMVGGDRGEDLGLVTYTWCETTRLAKAADGGDASNGSKPSVLGVCLSGSTHTRSIGLGMGTVVRLADESDVTQLHTVQVELERRAIDVCSQRVLERGLPMTIVDAEYQFDKKKLTFFYEAQQRMDFRELVRDLYKTFRARIWMEVVEN
ncbi:putative cell cycle sequence binding phosphoprotein (RBP45) [Trypanosoma grayi]|uniref:putative cell cycle sequence binding phosphoprotein (RBP45) n=1 Tax=Trypanosoma grayi TaxID=71804 RepID=UPI0004F4969A|nr:putative cell cycle sequence binding phosphoprotein (RBP45) [Trypanosoma grayi]KEG08298.1 putative cell cycle sequence binding phosphoprotein (RBP45) [Trypanosoma grayi]